MLTLWGSEDCGFHAVSCGSRAFLMNLNIRAEFLVVFTPVTELASVLQTLGLPAGRGSLTIKVSGEKRGVVNASLSGTLQSVLPRLSSGLSVLDELV